MIIIAMVGNGEEYTRWCMFWVAVLKIRLHALQSTDSLLICLSVYHVFTFDRQIPICSFWPQGIFIRHISFSFRSKGLIPLRVKLFRLKYFWLNRCMCSNFESWINVWIATILLHRSKTHENPFGHVIFLDFIWFIHLFVYCIWIFSDDLFNELQF